MWPLFELTGDKAVEPTKIVDAFVLPIVARAMKTETGSINGPSDTNLMEYLSHLTRGMFRLTQEKP
jgi:hypothetical protein